jgi:hypothetical protein
MPRRDSQSLSSARLRPGQPRPTLDPPGIGGIPTRTTSLGEVRCDLRCGWCRRSLRQMARHPFAAHDLPRAAVAPARALVSGFHCVLRETDWIGLAATKHRSAVYRECLARKGLAPWFVNPATATLLHQFDDDCTGIPLPRFCLTAGAGAHQVCGFAACENASTSAFARASCEPETQHLQRRIAFHRESTSGDLAPVSRTPG